MSEVCWTLQYRLQAVKANIDLCAVDTSSDPFPTSSPWTCIQFLGLHVHSDESSDHRHSGDDHQGETPDYLHKMLVVISGIYFFYLMETLFSLITYKDSNHHHHDHDHSVRERQRAAPKQRKLTEKVTIKVNQSIYKRWICVFFRHLGNTRTPLFWFFKINSAGKSHKIVFKKDLTLAKCCLNLKLFGPRTFFAFKNFSFAPNLRYSMLNYYALPPRKKQSLTTATTAGF